MKKTRLFSKITAMALVAIMACCMAASAYQGYANTLYGDKYGSYYAFSSLYVNGTRVVGAASVRTADYTKVPAGTLGCQATLAYVDNGEVFYQSNEAKNSSTDYFFTDQTPSRPAPRAACSVGWASVENSPYIRLRTCYEGDNYTRSAEMESQLAALAERTLTENNTYPVNADGKTYGSILLADMVGENPDLIAAVNQDNVSGYIRLEDITMPAQARAASQTLSLYDVDGNVIGDFERGEAEIVSVGETDFEAARTNVEHLSGR